MSLGDNGFDYESAITYIVQVRYRTFFLKKTLQCLYLLGASFLL